MKGTRAQNGLSITFVILHVFGMGGTIRTVITLANQLARNGHRVEIVSVVRLRESAFFHIDDGVVVRTLVDLFAAKQPGSGWRGKLVRLAHHVPTCLTHRGDNRYRLMSFWSDLVLLGVVRRLRSDVLVTTRPSLNVFAARFAPRRLVRVAQEHTFVESRPASLRDAIRRLYPRLDAVVTLTPSHRDDMERLLGGAARHLSAIPNSVDTAAAPVSSQANPMVVVAGRLAPGKQYHHLVRAFAQITRRHPDWKLRIYGSGPSKDMLQQLILDLGLHDNVSLMGPSDTIQEAYAQASLTVLTSRAEGLPMTLIEAMAAGVPAVSYDCPHGPRAIITHGQDGLLVPPNDIKAVARGIIELIEDKDRRLAMAVAARRTAMRFDSAVIADEWVSLFEQLIGRRRRTAAGQVGQENVGERRPS